MLHRIAFNFDKCQGAVPIAGLYAPSDADRRLGAALRGAPGRGPPAAAAAAAAAVDLIR